MRRANSTTTYGHCSFHIDLPPKVAADARLFATRGFVAFHQRNFQESAELLKAAIDSGNGNVDARLLLSEATFMSAKSAEKRDEVLADALAHAIQSLETAREARNDFEIERALLIRGSVLEAMGDIDGAWQSYQTALAIPTHSGKVEYFAARNRMFAGDSQAAKSILQRIPSDSQSAETLNLLARVWRPLANLLKSRRLCLGFPTIAFAQSALARGLCTKDEFLGLVSQLVLWNQVFVPVNADTLFKVLSDAGFVPDGRVMATSPIRCCKQPLAQGRTSLA